MINVSESIDVLVRPRRVRWSTVHWSAGPLVRRAMRYVCC